METLSKDTLRLLQDENVRKTVREVLDNSSSDESKTVKVQKDSEHEATIVKVRRLSA
jgi:hypothetical protein